MLDRFLSIVIIIVFMINIFSIVTNIKRFLTAACLTE